MRLPVLPDSQPVPALEQAARSQSRPARGAALLPIAVDLEFYGACRIPGCWFVLLKVPSAYP